MKFKLYEDIRVATWRRYSYEVEAETQEEAVELIKDGVVDCYDMEELYEGDIYLSPKDNGGYATHEIYSDKDELLYSNEE